MYIVSDLFSGISQSLNNQFFTSGFLLMAGGGLMAYFRNLPRQAWDLFMRRFTVTATVRFPDPSFDYLVAWLNSIPYSRKSRSVEVTVDKQSKRDTDYDDQDDDNSKLPVFLFTPSVGSHVFLHGRNVIWLSRDRTAQASPGKGGSLFGGGHGAGIEQSFTVRCFGHSQEPIRKLMEEAANVFMKPKDDRTRLLTAAYGSWREIGRVRQRSTDSVVLPTGVWDSILDDCRWFLGSQEWYRQRGVPYRRGYLLEGVPGAGKTATVQAIAGELGMTLCIMTVSGFGMSDQDLSNLFTSLPNKSIVLLEDIDAAFESRGKTEDNESKVTFSGLLNCIDGAASSEGRILFMTTNHVDKLDPALIRPGRCDVKIHYDNATIDQIERLYLRFFPESGYEDAIAFSAPLSGCGHSMAHIQDILIELSVAGLKHAEEAVSVRG